MYIDSRANETFDRDDARLCQKTHRLTFGHTKGGKTLHFSRRQVNQCDTLLI